MPPEWVARIRYFFRIIRVVSFSLYAVSMHFAFRAISSATPSNARRKVYMTITFLGGLFLLGSLWVLVKYCESDKASRKTKIWYGITSKILSAVGLGVCAVLSHSESYEYLIGVRMLDASACIFFVSLAAFFVSDFGGLDIFIAWWLSSICSNPAARNWLADKLDIEGDENRIKMELVVLFGFILIVRMLTVSLLNFLDGWAWSNDGFVDALGKFNGYRKVVVAGPQQTGVGAQQGDAIIDIPPPATQAPTSRDTTQIPTTSPGASTQGPVTQATQTRIPRDATQAPASGDTTQIPTTSPGASTQGPVTAVDDTTQATQTRIPASHDTSQASTSTIDDSTLTRVPASSDTRDSLPATGTRVIDDNGLDADVGGWLSVWSIIRMYVDHFTM